MRLTDGQMSLAVCIGELRVANGWEVGGGFRSAVAECAMALYTGFPWKAYRAIEECNGGSELMEPSVGPIEVKSILESCDKLILRSKPMMRTPHVRLLVAGDEVTFAGWAFGFEIWREKYWDESLPVPAYARQELYGLKSLCNWCRQSGWEIKAVDCPNFEKGWEPPFSS